MVSVVKASGEEEAFSEEKLHRSLRRTGAPEELVQRVVREVAAHVEPGMPTRKLYSYARKLLRRESRSLAARYSLKRAISELGPSGYPFERFVGAVLEARGCETRVGVPIDGAWVTHEIDVDARTPTGGRILVECKFHNHAGRRSDVKVALYVYARSLDLRQTVGDHEFWLVTNTRFTGDALRYGQGVGLEMRAWDYPEQGSLKDLVETTGLHPITALTSLKRSHTRRLLEEGVVLARSLCEQPNRLAPLGLGKAQREKILAEAEDLILGTGSE